MTTTRVSRFAATLAVLTCVVALAGCVPGAQTPAPTQTETADSSSMPTPSATAKPDPVLRPGASAAANKQFFDFVNKRYFTASGMGNGQGIVDNLVESGFVKTDMEVTFDTTALEIPVDSIIVSVRVSGECLIGQFSPSGYSSLQAPLLGTGSCLVGTTRPIDW